MFIAIDIERVLEKVYALSALNGVTAGTAGVKELLGAEHRLALMQIAQGAMAELVGGLGSIVKETNLGEAGDEWPALTMSISTDAESPAGIRMLLEEALSYGILSRATADRELASRAEELVKSAVRMAQESGGKVMIKEYY